MIQSFRIAAAAFAGVLVAGLCAGALAAGAGPRSGRAAADVILQVAPRGLGSVTADPPGRDGDNAPVSECTRNVAQHACEWRFVRGTAVTLSAKPDAAAGRSLAAWSTPDCPGTGSCTVVLDDDVTSVVAMFTPLRLAVRLSNGDAATIATNPPGSPCRGELHDPAPDLCREFSARTRVTVTATPKPSHAFGGWSAGCDPVGPASCAITVLDEATWVGVRLDDDRLPVLPTTIAVQFRLRKQGDGAGRVTASRLDCGSECSARYDYGTALVLTATAESGSVFAGWNGVCAATEPRCTVPVGPVTAVDARFAHAAVRPTAPASLDVTGRTRTQVSLSWRPSTGEAPVTGYRVYVDGVAKADTAGTTHTLRGLRCGHGYVVAVDAVDARGSRSARASKTVRTAPCPLGGRLLAVRVTRSGKARAIAVTLRVDRKATARATLAAHGRVVFRHRYAVRSGKSVLRVRVPRALPPGRYRLGLRLAARGGRTLALPGRNVRLPRR